jgi:NodT family efflux transporter outer membrane factor (OMF) lipoprotein
MRVRKLAEKQLCDVREGVGSMVRQLVTRCSRLAAVLAASIMLTGCWAVGPDFLHPAAPEVDGYTKETLAPRTSSTDAATGKAQRFVQGRDIPQEWWALFRSPALNALIERSLNCNPTLQAAMSALRAAKEGVYAQQGKFFPLVQTNFNPTRQLTASAITPVLNTSQNPFDLYTAQVQVSYTFDVWGLNRRTVESLRAQADAQRFQVEAAYLSLTSNVVVAAVTEASLRGQIDATNQLIALNKKALGTLRNQFNAGFANRSDVAAQEAALAQIEATLPPLRKALQQNRDLIAALAGGYPSEAPPEMFKLVDLQLPEDLPVSLPSQLIEQRPDVRNAEELLHSASALVGVSIANMLPNFTINANGGYINSALAGLISPVNTFWLLSGNATQTIFDGFTLLHQEREARATYDQAAWLYRAAVVGAVQNVADALRALQNDADALKAARDFERAAKISYDLARQQLDAGNINILLLLNAQAIYLQAEIQVVQARANRLADTAALFQALGGGWWNRVAPPTEKILHVGSGDAVTLVEQPAYPLKPWWLRDATATEGGAK